MRHIGSGQTLPGIPSAGSGSARPGDSLWAGSHPFARTRCHHRCHADPRHSCGDRHQHARHHHRCHAYPQRTCADRHQHARHHHGAFTNRGP
jgi:hypothetical protein